MKNRKESILEIPIKKIAFIPFLRRKWIDPEKFDELRLSVESSGVIQPVIVRKNESGGYELVSGERRILAARENGLKIIPSICRQVDDRDAILLMLNEKLQHEELSPFDVGLFINELINVHKMGLGEVAKKIGRCQGFVSDMISLLTLSRHTQELVYEKKLPQKQAYVIAKRRKEKGKEEEEKKERFLAELAIEHGLTDRELKKEVSRNKTKRSDNHTRTLSGIKISLAIEKHLDFLETVEANLHNISGDEQNNVVKTLKKMSEKVERILKQINSRKGAIIG